MSNTIIFETRKEGSSRKTWKNVVMPVKFGQFLDEQLDYAMVSLVRVKKKYFEPLTRARLTVISNTEHGGEQSKVIEYFVANDEYVEMPVGSGCYNHELSLIELTKFLECFPVESLCFTNPSGNNLIEQDLSFTVNTTGNAAIIYLTKSEINKAFRDNGIVTPREFGDLSFPSIVDYYAVASGKTYKEAEQYFDSIGDFNFNYFTNQVIVKEINGRETTYGFSYDYGKAEEVAYKRNEKIMVPIHSGVQEVKVVFSLSFGSGNLYEIRDMSFAYLVGVENKYPLKPWTNREVIERLLDLIEPIRKGETPRFSFDDEQKDLIVFNHFAPEYTMTRMNLRECLQMIGGRIHGEPRLKDGNVITYDFYGGQEQAYIKNYKADASKKICDYKHTVNKGRYDIEQTCTRLESYMDNFVNRINWQEATIGQPFENNEIGQTLRTTEYARVGEDDNYFFETAYPIDRPVLLEIPMPSLSGVQWLDITAYLYEKTVYDNLSGYNDYAPSKSYALNYTQGEKGIKGFFYKVPNATGGIRNNYSITNIINAVANLELSSPDITQLQLRLTYVPIYSARVSHGKQYLTDYIALPRTLNHSQSYNSVETRFYGQNIKSTAQRMGNIEQFYTFVVRNVENIPKAGSLWDNNYYIATVSVSVGFDLFEVTVGVSKNFNRKSQYIGANSYKRIYEVSEKMVTERNPLYQDYVVITDGTTTTYQRDNPYLTTAGIESLLKKSFLVAAGSADYDEISVAQVITFSKNETALHGVLRPVICSAFGNTIEFSWEMKDNFSAGTRMDGNYTTDEDGIKAVFGLGTEYGDYYGRAWYMRFLLYSKQQADNILNVSYSEGWANADTFPLSLTGEVYNMGYMVKGDKVLLRKDSREALRFGYSVEFVADGEEFILGQGLTEKNPLVTSIIYANTDNLKKPHLYLLPFKINKYADALTESELALGIDLGLANTTEFKNLSNVHFLFRGKIAEIADGETYQSWAYVYPIVQGSSYTVSNEDGSTETYTPTYGGDIVLAKNVDIKNGDRVGAFEAIVVHDIFNYIKSKNN